MKSPRNKTHVAFESVITTHQLLDRAPRLANPQEEYEAFCDLVLSLSEGPDQLPDKLVEVGLGLCRAGTFGLSIQEDSQPGEGAFQWLAVAGKWKRFIGSKVPREFSASGICLDSNEPLLLSRLDGYGPHSKPAFFPFVEALFVPWVVRSGRSGTIWAVVHTDNTRFDLHDVQIMTSLAAFAASGFQIRDLLQEAHQRSVKVKMAGSIAHLINNPLQAAVSALYLLKSCKNLDSNSQDIALLLENAIERIIGLSSAVLQNKLYEVPPRKGPTRVTSENEKTRVLRFA